MFTFETAAQLWNARRISSSQSAGFATLLRVLNRADVVSFTFAESAAKLIVRLPGSGHGSPIETIEGTVRSSSWMTQGVTRGGGIEHISEKVGHRLRDGRGG